MSAILGKMFCLSYRWEDAGHSFRMLVLGLCIVVTTHAAAAGESVPGTQDRRAPPSEVIAFDLPAQPLVAALEAYGAESGWQVVYESRLAAGRRSNAVEGTYTREDALRRLLAGTGLAPRYMAADGFVLVPEAPPATPRGLSVDAPPPEVARYYGRIQAGLRESVCADQQARAGGYRVAVGLWFGAAGAVTRLALLDSTGDPGLDETLARDVATVNVGEAPPAGVSQPVVVVITPDVMRDCRGVPRAEAAP